MDTLRTQLEQELQLLNLPPEERDKVIATLGEHILRRSVLKIYETLPENYRASVEQVQATGDPKLLYEVLSHSVPNIENLLEEVAKEVVSEFKQAL
jgi:predicted ATP-grasp superfamily ATP-dependent carboligase